MNLYYFKKRLRYRLFAKTRHDIHSPFVFQFIEVVLRDKSKPFRLKIENYFAGNELLFLSISQLPEYFNAGLQNDTIVVVTDIYESENYYQLWQQYATNSKVPLSMEAGNYGFLCFKKDFVVKQHFIVK